MARKQYPDWTFDGVNWVCKRCRNGFNLLASSQNDYRCPNCRTRVTIKEVKMKQWTRLCKDQSLILSPVYGGVRCDFTNMQCKPSNVKKCLIRNRVNSGKCPSCNELISTDDLAPLPTPLGGVAWVCKKCESIIGFESKGSGIIGRVSAISEEERLRMMDDDRMMFEHFY